MHTSRRLSVLRSCSYNFLIITITPLSSPTIHPHVTTSNKPKRISLNSKSPKKFNDHRNQFCSQNQTTNNKIEYGFFNSNHSNSKEVARTGFCLKKKKKRSRITSFGGKFEVGFLGFLFREPIIVWNWCDRLKIRRESKRGFVLNLKACLF